MSALELIRTALVRDGGKHIGDVVYWSLAEAQIARADLENAWTASQLDPHHLPEPQTSERAFKLAVREASVGQAQRLIRLGREDENEIVFAVVSESRDAAGNVYHQQETRVLLNRRTDIVSSDVPEHDLAGVIAARFAELRNLHTPDDVRRAVMRQLDAAACCVLRPHGGIYFVPAPYAETVRRLQACITRIGHSKLYVLPIYETPDSAQAVGDAAKVAIEDELAALKSEVEGFLREPPERASTLVRRLDAFDALRARAELYRSVLNVRVQDLDADLAALSANVETLLAQKADERAAA